MRRLVIYTDLDGSLLDHNDYSHAAADPLLTELETDGIPVVPTTSKTRAELLPLREELGNQHPFIIENGAGVCIPQGYFERQPEGTDIRNGIWIKSFAKDRAQWQSLLNDLPDSFANDYKAFFEMDVDEIVSLTGLTKADAALANQREFGEPVHWRGSESSKQRFIQTLQQAGATVLQGGRFLHISGDCNKGKALLWLNEQYANQYRGETPLSIAAGDSQNDVAMLEAADYAAIIRSPAHPPPTLERKTNTLISDAPGPKGWAECIESIMHTISEDKG